MTKTKIQRHSERGEKVLYSVFTKSAGGFGQKLALELLRGEGILATPGSAPYAGQTGVWVFGDERVQRKAKRILYSY